MKWSDQWVVKVGAAVRDPDAQGPQGPRRLQLRRDAARQEQRFEPNMTFPAVAEHHVTVGAGYDIGKWAVNAAFMYSPEASAKFTDPATTDGDHVEDVADRLRARRRLPLLARDPSTAGADWAPAATPGPFRHLSLRMTGRPPFPAPTMTIFAFGLSASLAVASIPLNCEVLRGEPLADDRLVLRDALRLDLLALRLLPLPVEGELHLLDALLLGELVGDGGLDRLGEVHVADQDRLDDDVLPARGRAGPRRRSAARSPRASSSRSPRAGSGRRPCAPRSGPPDRSPSGRSRGPIWVWSSNSSSTFGRYRTLASTRSVRPFEVRTMSCSFISWTRVSYGMTLVPDRHDVHPLAEQLLARAAAEGLEDDAAVAGRRPSGSRSRGGTGRRGGTGPGRGAWGGPRGAGSPGA